MTNKSVLINLGSGDLYQGFPRVIAQLWDMNRSFPEQYLGSLPAAPVLVSLYRNWQTVYQGLCDRFQLRSPPAPPEDGLEIAEVGVTNVSQYSFEELCLQLQSSLNQWLKSETFLNIDRQLRSQLDPSEEIRVVIETNDELMRRLPWQLWEFFRDYPKAEVALARPEYKRREPTPTSRPVHTKVRLLAILGDTRDIDLENERHFLQQLEDADVELLVNPSRPEFTIKLWDPRGWDILFFAGHSRSEGETGRIYLNENPTDNSLTIEQLEEALKTAVEYGLQLAIFNSCDGLGLAIALEKLSIPVAIVMREPVPNRVAQEFFNYFLTTFALERQSLYLAVQQARRKLQGLENEFPGASWLPAICQNPAVEPPTWLQLGGIPPSPYPGLSVFRSEDASFFQGRETAAQELAIAVQKKPLLAVVGDSGSGKSSLIQAGLIPKLQAETSSDTAPLTICFCPSSHLFQSLAEALSPYFNPATRSSESKLELFLRQNSQALGTTVEQIVRQSGTHLILIVDAFETLYTLCSEPDRQRFLNSLLSAVRSAPGFSAVLVLRSDCYPQVLTDRSLRNVLQDSVQRLNPMSRAELQAAIEQPALQVGVRCEKGLVDKLILDLGHSHRLSLLQLVLTQLWPKQQNGWLTHHAYEEMGGLSKVLALYAEATYAQLDEADRRKAQQVFVQLVRWGKATEPLPRVATQAEIKSENWELVRRLATARLVITQASDDQATVALGHELLLQSWGRLEHWLQVDGEFRRWQDHLRAMLKTWQENGCEEAELLQGKPLIEAEVWYQERAEDLSAAERDFIQLSQKCRKQQLRQEKRRIFVLKSLLTVTTLAFIGALGLSAFAFWQYRRASQGQVAAIAMNSNNLFSLDRRLDALIQAINAQGLLQQVPFADRTIVAAVRMTLLQAVYGADEFNRLLGERALAFRPDGTLMATSVGTTIRLWQPDGKPVGSLAGHTGSIWSLAFNPVQAQLASGGEDTTVRIWPLGGEAIVLQGHSAVVRQVAFSPDGKLLASASDDGTIKLWKPDGSLVQTLPDHRAPVWGIAFSADGRTLASAGHDNTIRLWRLHQGKATLRQTLTGHTDVVLSVAFSPDGQSLVSAGQDKTIKRWQRDAKGQFGPRPIATFTGQGAAVSKVVFSPDGRTIASISGDMTVKLWNPEGHLLNTLNGNTQQVRDVAFSPDGQTLATSGGIAAQTRLWRLTNPAIVTLEPNQAAVFQANFSPKDQILATASNDKTVKLWQVDGSLIKTLKVQTAGMLSAVFSPDGKTIATGSQDGKVTLWQVGPQLNPETPIRSFSADTDVVWQVVFSPDGQRLATTSRTGLIKIWNREGQLLQTLTGHQGEVRSITFTPDGKHLVSGGFDRTVKIWEANGTLVQTLVGHSDRVLAVAVSPDGQKIAAAGDDQLIRMWSWQGTLLKQFSGHSADIRSLMFSPNGRLLASGGADKTIKLWQMDGTELATLKGHGDAVWHVAFSPNGQTLASSSEEGTVKLWRLNLLFGQDRLLNHACEWVHSYLLYRSDWSATDRIESVEEIQQFCRR